MTEFERINMLLCDAGEDSLPDSLLDDGGFVDSTVNHSGNGSHEKTTDSWRLYSATDFLEERPPIKELVAGILAETSIGMVFGASGSLKSCLLMDLCVCVSAGKAFLQGDQLQGHKTEPGAVVWLNVDNPTRTVLDRFGAFIRGHELEDFATGLPVYAWSFPNPIPDATNAGAMLDLALRVERVGAQLLVVDCLQAVRGDTDENAAEMGIVIAAFRRLAEQTGAAVVLVHHVNKEGGFRGSTAIENLVDYSLKVDREQGSDTVTVSPGKMRDALVEPFAARFDFTHREGTRELQTARFFATELEGNSEANEWGQTILRAVTSCPGLTQRKLAEVVQEDGITRKELRKILRNPGVLKLLKIETGPNGSFLYYPASGAVGHEWGHSGAAPP